MQALQETDEELAARSAAGDSEAFAGLYERYFDALYDFTMRTVRNSELASDAVQNTFTKAWESLQKGEPPTHAKAWLYAIARNNAVDEVRVRRRELPGDEEGDGGEDETVSFSVVDQDRYSNPEEATQDKELIELVWSSAASLSAKDYSLLDLHVRRGLNADELADSLGLRKGNVYTMLSRLRDSLEDSVTANLLARRGRDDCKELDALLDVGEVTNLGRQMARKIQQHVRGCSICQESKQRFASPVEMFAGLAPVGAAVGLKPTVWAKVESQASSSGATSPAIQAWKLNQLSWKSAAFTATFSIIGLLIALLVLSGGGPGLSDPSDVRSPSHEIGVESSDRIVALVWSAQQDVSGYSILWSETEGDLPDTTADLPGDATSTQSSSLSDGDWYFHLRTQGKNGNWTSTVQVGPFRISSDVSRVDSQTRGVPIPFPNVGTPTVAPSITAVPSATLAPSATAVPSPTSVPSATPTHTPQPLIATVMDEANDVMLVDGANNVQGPAPNSEGDITSFDVSHLDGVFEICVVRTISAQGFSSSVILTYGDIKAGWQIHDGQLTTLLTRLGTPIAGATVVADPLGRRVCFQIPWDGSEEDLSSIQSGWSVESFHLQNNDGSMRHYDQYP